MNESLLKKRLREASRTEPADAAGLVLRDGSGCVFGKGKEALQDVQTLWPVIGEIERRLSEHGRALAAIDGPCGSGKTALARTLCALYDTQPIPMDDFFLPFEMRTEERLRQPGGNVHYERFLDEVLSSLARGGDVAYRRFDCQTGAFCPRLCRRAPLMVIEGSYSHHPAFWQAYEKMDAMRVFVWTEEGEQLRRLRMRSPGQLERFQSLWIPLEKKYIQAYHIQSGANIVLQSHPWESEEERE